MFKKSRTKKEQCNGHLVIKKQFYYHFTFSFVPDFVRNTLNREGVANLTVSPLDFKSCSSTFIA